MLLRQKSGAFHSYPEHRRGFGGLIRRLLWRLGFDPLTVYERLVQVETECAYWQDLYMLNRPPLSPSKP